MRSSRKVTYAYDHVGRNVMKDGARYIWDDYNIVVENTGAENVTCNTWGLDLDGTMQGLGGVGGLLAVTKEGDCTIPAYDGNGNITEYISDDGTIVFHSDYSSFGRERLTCGDNNYSHRFSTKPTCRRSGLVEYQMRKYMPWLGRWGARDPIEEEGGLNIFEHVFNDPINNSEVKGTIPRALAVAIFIIGMEALFLRYCAESSQNKLPSRPTSDAFKHCYVSCENAKCLAKLNSMPIGKALTRLGGVAHEIIQLISGEAHTLEGSLADIKSNERGINAAGNGKDCNDACGCENEHNNPL